MQSYLESAPLPTGCATADDWPDQGTEHEFRAFFGEKRQGTSEATAEVCTFQYPDRIERKVYIDGIGGNKGNGVMLSLADFAALRAAMDEAELLSRLD